MLTALARAFAALAVPVLKPLADALAREWDDGTDEITVVRTYPVGFRKPDDDGDGD